MKRERTTKDVWIMKSNYGYGWTDEIEENTWKEMRAQLRVYRANCPDGCFRAVKRRERIEITK